MHSNIDGTFLDSNGRPRPASAAASRTGSSSSVPAERPAPARPAEQTR